MTNEDRLFPADWQNAPRYAGAYSFMRLPLSRDLTKADVAIVGAPFDIGVVHRPGARFGPRAIRNASAQVRPYPMEAKDLWGPFTRLRVLDYGDVDVVPAYIDENLNRIRDTLAPIFAAGVTPIVLGGDHTITLPVLRACAPAHGPVSLVHFDSHPDYWPPPSPERPYHHGTVYRIAEQEGLIRLDTSVQVGIRGTISMAIVEECRAAGFHLITADEFAAQGVAATVAQIRERVQGPVYLSFDIDAADPAFAPGTGTPEVAGLTSRELMAIVRGLRGLDVVAFDVVEVAPPYDHAEITSLLAANLVYEFLEIRAARPERSATEEGPS
ncbi:MAG: agmatinase [Dehalococcoidia bacterium]